MTENTCIRLTHERRISSNLKKKLAKPRHDDWPLITEFTYRCYYFQRWILAGVLGAVILAFVGLYLSALGAFLLLTLYGALRYLRCPACDAATTLKGVTDGYTCRSCGQRLRL